MLGTRQYLMATVFTVANIVAAVNRGPCDWDPSKPFSEFTSCLGHRRIKRNYYGVEGHPCHHYVRLNQPERRTGNRINRLTDGALCDRTLNRRWYRFEGPGGGAMPESCVDEFSCGTHAPIWLNARHPTRYGEKRDLEVCMSLGGNCCARRWYIRVANCGDFYAYLLTDTPGCFMAYCAGAELKCPEGQSSPTGYSPGCSDNYPKLAEGSRAQLSLGPEGDKVAIYCDYEGPIPMGTTLEVQWFVQGDNSGEGDAGKYAIFTDSLIQRRRSILTEGHWMGKLGSSVFCQIRAKWRNNTGVPGPPLDSEKHFYGVKILKRVIDVGENEAETQIQVQSTMPVTCLPQFSDACSVTLQLGHDKDYQARRCVDGRLRQVVFGDCSIRLTPDNWDQVHNVTVKAVRDFVRDGTKSMRVNFKAVASTTASPIWNDYRLPEIEVLAKDIPTKMCSSTGDPHYSTFDGLYYHVYKEGEFVLYKHAKYPIQINTRLEKCGKSVTCNCGVAVMAADDVIVIDRCLRQQRNAAFGQSFPNGFRTIHRHALEQGGDFIKGLKIYEYDEGRRYTIHLPTGAYIEFMIGESWINLHLYGASDDWKSTMGLCGTFDGNKYNDFLHPDEVTQSLARDDDKCGDDTNVCDFAEAWRVADDKSFFGEIVEVPIQQYDFSVEPEQYCKCETADGDVDSETTVVCNYNYDVNNCQAESQQTRGEDRTEDLLLRSRTRRSAELHDEDTDYFQSQFLFDPDFIGEEPSWPTPSGIDQQQARAYCMDFILRSEVASTCNRVIAEELSRIVDACATDIKVTDSFEWARASLSSYVSECLDKVNQEPTFWVPETDDVTSDEAPSLGDTIVQRICPNDCSKRGICTAGTCTCVNGYGGQDCSLDLRYPPHISYVSSGGFCNIRQRSCKHIRIYGEGFRNESISCLFRVERGTDVNIHETEATFDTFEEVICATPSHGVVPGDPDGRGGSPFMIYHVYLELNDVRTNDVAVVIYDDVCIGCTINNTEGRAVCFLKDHTCLVNGYCFAAEERDPNNCCKLCQPSASTEVFTTISGNRAPILKPRRNHYILAQGQSLDFTIKATDPEGCDVEVEIDGPEASWFQTSISGRVGHVEVDAAEVGAWTITISAHDECGASREQKLPLLVTEDNNSTGLLDGINCTDNQPPEFHDIYHTFTLVRNESLQLYMTVSDTENHPLSYYCLSYANATTSIDETGVFRYTAPDREVEDHVVFLTEDACGARDYMRISITTITCPCEHGHCVADLAFASGTGHYHCQCEEGFRGKLCRRALSRTTQTPWGLTQSP